MQSTNQFLRVEVITVTCSVLSCYTAHYQQAKPNELHFTQTFSSYTDQQSSTIVKDSHIAPYCFFLLLTEKNCEHNEQARAQFVNIMFSSSECIYLCIAYTPFTFTFKYITTTSTQNNLPIFYRSIGNNMGICCRKWLLKHN